MQSGGVPRVRWGPFPSLYVAAIVAIFGVVLAAVSLAGPSYTYRRQGANDWQQTDFGLSGVSYNESISGQTETWSENYARFPEMAGPIYSMIILTVMSLVLGALSSAAALAGFHGPALRKTGSLLSVAGGILVFVAALLLVTSLGWFVEWASVRGLGSGGVIYLTGETFTWGPGWAWYLVIVGGVLMFAGGTLGLAMKAPTQPILLA